MRYAALHKAKQDGFATEYWRESNPRCPHCGETYEIAANEAYQLYGNDDDQDVTCDKCTKDFTVSIHVEYKFSTDEQPDEDDDESEPADWEDKL